MIMRILFLLLPWIFTLSVLAKQHCECTCAEAGSTAEESKPKEFLLNLSEKDWSRLGYDLNDLKDRNRSLNEICDDLEDVNTVDILKVEKFVTEEFDILNASDLTKKKTDRARQLLPLTICLVSAYEIKKRKDGQPPEEYFVNLVDKNGKKLGSRIVTERTVDLSSMYNSMIKRAKRYQVKVKDFLENLTKNTSADDKPEDQEITKRNEETIKPDLSGDNILYL